MENNTMTNLTQQEIEEGNKLIAEFEGMVYTNDDPKAYAQGYMFSKELGAITVADLQYHESWDWLMPIVEKLSNEFTLKNKVEYYKLSKDCFWALSITSDITMVWLAVTSAIKFINSKNK